ncbi:MAG: hypothetical protein MHPSP_001568, partial [Paramarteilia canceri]
MVAVSRLTSLLIKLYNDFGVNITQYKKDDKEAIAIPNSVVFSKEDPLMLFCQILEIVNQFRSQYSITDHELFLSADYIDTWFNADDLCREVKVDCGRILNMDLKSDWKIYLDIINGLILKIDSLSKMILKFICHIESIFELHLDTDIPDIEELNNYINLVMHGLCQDKSSIVIENTESVCDFISTLIIAIVKIKQEFSNSFSQTHPIHFFARDIEKLLLDFIKEVDKKDFNMSVLCGTSLVKKAMEVDKWLKMAPVITRKSSMISATTLFEYKDYVYKDKAQSALMQAFEKVNSNLILLIDWIASNKGNLDDPINVFNNSINYLQNCLKRCDPIFVANSSLEEKSQMYLLDVTTAKRFYPFYGFTTTEISNLRANDLMYSINSLSSILNTMISTQYHFIMAKNPNVKQNF